VLYEETVPQFRRAGAFDADNAALGLYVFVIGLVKKLVIADTIAVFADNGFSIAAFGYNTSGLQSPELGVAAAWVASLSYTFQIYFDFSGYSDMAVGLARMFNVALPANFDSPYLSKSVTEFWRRWHMTLGRALGADVYVPLGGNRRGHVRTCLNLLLTFLVSGLWHGASWTFVLWGGLHGACSVLDRLFERHLAKLPGALRVAGTFIVVNLLWVLFRAESTEVAAKVYRGMFGAAGVNFRQLREVGFDGIINFPLPLCAANIALWLGVCFAVVFLRPNSNEMARNFSPAGKGKSSAVLTAFLFLLAVICMSRTSPFIYFNF
jgi:alginate O-acetyltransferase complex protein AlgI